MFEELKAIKAQVEAAGIDTESVEADINGWYFIDTKYTPEYVCEQLNLAGFYCAPITDMQYDGTWRYRISLIASPTTHPAPATAPAAGEVGGFDPYLVAGSRLELLEEFYKFMVDMDAIYELKNELESAGEMESWRLLSALEYSLRKTQQAAQASADGGE